MRSSSHPSPGQRLLTVAASPDFIGELDAALSRIDYGNRDELVRDAIYEKLKKNKTALHPGLARTPSRKGKGGPRALGNSAKGAVRTGADRW